MPIESVKYRVLVDGLSESCNPKPTASVPYLVDWRDRWRFVAEVLGSPPSVEPEPYPDLAGLVALSVSSIEGRGILRSLATTSPLSFFRKAIVKVEFGYPEWKWGSQLDPEDPLTLCEVTSTFAGSMRTLPRGAVVFDSGDPIEGDAGKLEIEAEITASFPKIAEIPVDVLHPRLGAINKYRVFRCDPGTLLFAGYDARTSTQLSYTLGGVGAELKALNEMELKFLFTNVGWNKMLKADGTYELVKYKDTTIRPYAEEDFSLLLRP